MIAYKLQCLQLLSYKINSKSPKFSVGTIYKKKGYGPFSKKFNLVSSPKTQLDTKTILFFIDCHKYILYHPVPESTSLVLTREPQVTEQQWPLLLLFFAKWTTFALTHIGPELSKNRSFLLRNIAYEIELPKLLFW